MAPKGDTWALARPFALCLDFYLKQVQGVHDASCQSVTFCDTPGPGGLILNTCKRAYRMVGLGIWYTTDIDSDMSTCERKTSSVHPHSVTGDCERGERIRLEGVRQATVALQLSRRPDLPTRLASAC